MAEVTRISATLVEVNGLWVLLPLSVPILLTGSALLTLLFARKRHIVRMTILWAKVVVFLGFCFLAMFSIGIFYLPAAVALLIAAVSDLLPREVDVAGQEK